MPTFFEALADFMAREEPLVTVTIVDTMGGMNLRMGNYEYTPDDRMWDAVSLQGEKSWVHGLSPHWSCWSGSAVLTSIRRPWY